MVMGIIFLVLGLAFWVSNYFPEFDVFGILNLDKNWPFFLVLIGVYIVIHQFKAFQDSDSK